MALSTSKNELDLTLSPDNSGDNRIEHAVVEHGWYHEERRKRIPIRAIGLANWLAENGKKTAEIGLIWLDVQGHEVYALTGAEELLKDVPVVTEIWPYALERSGLGVAHFIQLAAKYFHEFMAVSPSAVPTQIGQLSAFIENIGRFPRNAAQIILLPRRRSGHLIA